MSGIVQQTLPTAEPITLAAMKSWLKINTSKDDADISALITAARTYLEDATGLFLAPRTFAQYLDGFPSFPYIPGYGLVPSISSGFPFAWNYPTAQQGTWMARRNPFEVHLAAWPVTAIAKVTYIAASGNPTDLTPGEDFIMDLVSRPARISPLPAATWPISLLFTNSVGIFFSAGFDPDPTTITDETVTVPTPPEQIAETKFVSGIPETLKVAVRMLVSHWYFNREPVTAGGAASVPHSVDQLIQLNRIFNFGPFDTVNG